MRKIVWNDADGIFVTNRMNCLFNLASNHVLFWIYALTNYLIPKSQFWLTAHACIKSMYQNYTICWQNCFLVLPVHYMIFFPTMFRNLILFRVTVRNGSLMFFRSLKVLSKRSLLKILVQVIMINLWRSYEYWTNKSQHF